MVTDIPSIPPGMRLYAIGDVHGCLPLLKKLVEMIDEECKRDGVTARKIFLGDYIDRGLQSRHTIDFCLDLQKTEEEPPIFLMGNHEKVMHDIVVHAHDVLFRDWIQFGGRETMLSYGVPFADISAGPKKAMASLAEKTPPTHITFLKNLQLCVTFGDYYFCHAGVRPGRDLAQQKIDDLIWIRQEFLFHDKPFGKIVVHGHSIRPQAEFKSNRIGIDTGAYATGCLTALGLEGTKQWLVQTK